MIKKSLLIALLIIFFFNSCKKYDEGPRLSWYSKKTRISGSWIYWKVTYNDIDSTKNFLQSTIIFDKNGTFVYVNQEEEEAIYAIPGQWELIENKEKLRLAIDTSFYPFYEGDWTIKRLNYYDFWMEITDSMNNNIRWELLK